MLLAAVAAATASTGECLPLISVGVRPALAHHSSGISSSLAILDKIRRICSRLVLPSKLVSIVGVKLADVVSIRGGRIVDVELMGPSTIAPVLERTASSSVVIAKLGLLLMMLLLMLAFSRARGGEAVRLST